MGMHRTITFAGQPPSWQAIRDRITAAGLTVSLRMIDGLPAFPDELPEDGWRELRISTPTGMMTLRLDAGKLTVVVWGNAGPELVREWEMVAEASAAAANGQVQP